MSTLANATPGRKARFGLRFLLLVIACTASCVAYFTSQHSISNEIRRIEELHLFAPHLFVRNANEYSCLWIEHTARNNEFHCYLPSGANYRLNLKWKDAFYFDRPLGKPDLSHEISAGTHRIFLETGERLKVLIEDEVVFDEPNADTPASTSFRIAGASTAFQGQWADVEKPLVLFKYSKFDSTRSANARAKGVALWIDRVD